MSALKSIKFIIPCLVFFLLNTINVSSQWGFSSKPVAVIVSADHSDWKYHTVEKVTFNIQVLKNRNPLKGVKVSYKIMPEKMEPRQSKTIALPIETHTVNGGIMKISGFYGWGYNTAVCPPTSMFSAYSVITALKTLDIMPDKGHFSYQEQKDKANTLLFEKLLSN